MNSKERVLASLTHKQPDRVAVDFGATPVTGIHVLPIEKLRKHFGLDEKPVRVIEPYQMLGEIDSVLLDALGVDVVGLSPHKNMFGIVNEGSMKEFTTFWGQKVLVPQGFNTTFDQEGNLEIYPEGDTSLSPSGKMPKASYFFDAIIRQEPIDDDKLNPDENLEEFNYLSEDDLTYWKGKIEGLANTDRAVIANFGGTAFGDIALVPAMNLKNPKGIRDITEWYMSTMMRPDYIHEVFETQSEIALHNLEKLNGVVGDRIDAVFLCGTDFGTQDSQFCSIETLNELYFPYYKKVNDWIHKNTNWKTFKHSCGAVEPFIDTFIEAGFDILNPVQISATGMDPKHLKEVYGDHIVFWGGGVDTQQVLSFGTPKEVGAQVLSECEILSPGGGFVFNTVHNIQANVPLENLIAMLNAIKDFNGE